MTAGDRSSKGEGDVPVWTTLTAWTAEEVLAALPAEVAAAVRLAGGEDIGVHLVVRPGKGGRLTADVDVDDDLVATDVLDLGPDEAGYSVAVRELWTAAFELGVSVVKGHPWGTTTSRRVPRDRGSKGGGPR